MNLSVPAAASLLLFESAVALANGAVSEFPAGGVVFKPDKEISIAREDLEIGWDLIRVRYVFESSASEPLERTIGFPLARVPLEDGPDHVGNISWAESGDDPRNYMAFQVTVDGTQLTPRLHEFAWLGEANVTSRLIGMGVPIFAADGGTLQKLANLPRETVAALQRQKLVVGDDPGGWLVPSWDYQAVFEWTQIFAPGETVVEISYRPLFGAGYDYSYYYEDGEGASIYCLEGARRDRLARMRQEGNSPEPFTVGYILQNARNWHGPIGEFRLKVTDGRDSLFSFCLPDGLKSTDEGNRWVAKDFVPRSDLKIVFYIRD